LNLLQLIWRKSTKCETHTFAKFGQIAQGGTLGVPKKSF
jgi:hypothetical protein